MKISVCIPVVGRKRWFCQAVYSLLLQGYENWELVVRDGNTDAPLEQDADVAALLGLVGENRLRYEVGPNLGLFPGYNECLKRATGDVMYCMGSDDLLSPGALVCVAEAFGTERYPTVFWLYGKTVSADSEGRKLGVDGAVTNYRELLKGNKIGLPSVFWSRGMMELGGTFDPRYRWAADYELWLRFWKRREPAFLDQELGIYRHHDEQASRVNAVELDDEAERVRQRHRALGDLIAAARNIYSACRTYGVKIMGGDEHGGDHSVHGE